MRKPVNSGIKKNVGTYILINKHELPLALVKKSEYALQLHMQQFQYGTLTTDFVASREAQDKF